MSECPLKVVEITIASGCPWPYNENQIVAQLGYTAHPPIVGLDPETAEPMMIPSLVSVWMIIRDCDDCEKKCNDAPKEANVA